MSELIKTLCSAVDSKGSGSKVQVRDSSEGVSVQSYLQGAVKNVPAQKRQKVLDSAECLKLTCSLFSMPRSERRKFLSRVSDSVRRQLISEGKHIRKLITDSCIAYDPELCWALENTINGSDETAEEILEERFNRNRLPEDVKKWYLAYQKNPYGDLTRKLEKLLKPFKLTRVNKVKDDTNVDAYLDDGKKQESAIQGALDEEAAGAAALSEQAQEQLNEIKETVADRTKSFIEALVDEVVNVVPSVATQNAVDRASERTEEIINEEGELGEQEADAQAAEEDEVFNSEYEEYDDKVGDSLQVLPSIGQRIIVEGDSESPRFGEEAIIEAVLPTGVVSARFEDGELYGYGKNEYRVLDSVEEQVSEGDIVTVVSGDYAGESGKVQQINPDLGVALVLMDDNSFAISDVSNLKKKVEDCAGEPSTPPVTVVVSKGITSLTTGTGISVMVDNAKFDGVVASTDGETLTIKSLPKEFYEAVKAEPVEEYTIPQKEVTFEEEEVVDPNSVQQEGSFDSKPIEETVEESMTDEVWDSLEALYPDAAKIADSVDLDGVENVTEEFQVGSVVDFQNDTWKVTKAGKESITLKKTSTGEEQVVNKDCFSDVYVIQPARCIQDSEESDAVKRIVYNWLKKNSAELATNSEADVRRAAFEELSVDLAVIDEGFEFSTSNESGVDYRGNLFMKDAVSTLLVGGISFVYQATDLGVEAIAEQASTAASELYLSYTNEEETFETEETLTDALDALQSGQPVNVIRVQDDEGKIIVMMSDIFGRDVKYVTDEGETSNKDEAKRFSDKREAFQFMKALSDAGKLTHSIYNSSPLQVADAEESVLSDEAKAEVLQKVEEEVVNRLKEKGVDVSDSIQNDGNAIAMVNKAIEEAEKETETDLTPEQKESGNYKKGHVKIQDFDIAIENPKGSVRSGVDKDGKEWSQEMHNTYGYFEGTKGKDSDDVDCFIGPNPLSEDIFVIDQLDKDGNFDEHKVMFGFDSSEEAREAYLSNYEEGWTGLGDITKVNVEDFRKWVQKDDVRSKPFTEYLKVTDSYFGATHSIEYKGVKYTTGNDITVDGKDGKVGTVGNGKATVRFDDGTSVEIEGKTSKIEDAMDPNEDGDDHLFVNWGADQLMEYYDKVRKRKVAKEDRKALRVKDDEEIGEEKYAEFEQKLLEALNALGIDPNEQENPQLPIPTAEVKEGRDNTYDAPHNATTFRNLRDTEMALSKVLEIASKLAGKDKVLTVEEYKKILEESPEDPILPIVADSTFTVGELDLICPELYKRKFTDKFWVADSIDALGDAFNIEIPEQYREKSALVSTSPINAKGMVVDSILEYPYSETHKLYVAPLKSKM